MTHTESREAGAHALLWDGATVRIRPAPPGDSGAVLRLSEEMSAENPRSRFFGHRGGGPAVDLNPAVARHDGVVAVDVRVRVLPRHPDNPYLRRLR
jgi:hypothetical protein